mgnify:CR=1 FL=1
MKTSSVSSLEQIIENLFFKKRYIYATRLDDFVNIRAPEESQNITCKMEDMEDKDHITQLLESICDDKSILRAINNIISSFKDCILISAYYNDVAVGCIIIIAPQEPIVYDSCRFTENQVRFAQLYVNSHYRRMGISSHLRYSAFEHWRNLYPNRTVIGIIERSNIASLKGANKMNYNLEGSNYLLKFFGINILSISNRAGRWEYLFLLGKGRHKKENN